MKGEEVKEILRKRKISVSEVARQLGMQQQTLSSALLGDDIRTGLLESIADLLGEPVTYFYTGESSGAAVVNGGTVNGNVTGKNDEGPAVSAIVAQLDTKDQQIDRLLRIIERMQQ